MKRSAWATVKMKPAHDLAVAMPALAGHRAGEEAQIVEQGPVLLSSPEGRPADPATPLYNLHLDGDHTYFADDLLVHSKFFQGQAGTRGPGGAAQPLRHAPDPF